MVFPWNEIGGGAVVGLAWLGRTLMLRRKNGKNGNRLRPGESKICVDNTNLLASHETLLIHMCKTQDKNEKAVLLVHKESRDDYKEINTKLDDLKNRLIGG